MKRSKRKLPELSYVAVATESVLCIIKQGERGYHRTDFPIGKRDANEFAAEMNRRMGLTKFQTDAMTIGSMRGWHVPGADPAFLERSAKEAK